MSKPCIFFDYVSQPSRAVLLFIRALGLDIAEKPVALHKGAQRAAEFLEINPLGKVPCLQLVPGDKVLVIPESCAILRYLATTNRPAVPDHWYPEEPVRRARVDAAMDWYHSTVRKGAAGQVFNRVIAAMQGQPGNEAVAADSEGVLRHALQALESYWLGNSSFVAGDAVSIGDLPIASELEQLRMLAGATQGPSMAEQLADFPRVREWMERVRDTLEPHYSDVHAMLDKAAKNAQRRKERAQAKL